MRFSASLNELVDSDVVIEKEEDHISSSKQKSGFVTKFEGKSTSFSSGGEIIVARGHFPIQIKTRIHGTKISNGDVADDSKSFLKADTVANVI